MKNQQTYSVADSDTHDLLGEGLTRDEVNNIRLQHEGEVQVFREAPSLLSGLLETYCNPPAPAGGWAPEGSGVSHWEPRTRQTDFNDMMDEATDALILSCEYEAEGDEAKAEYFQRLHNYRYMQALAFHKKHIAANF